MNASQRGRSPSTGVSAPQRSERQRSARRSAVVVASSVAATGVLYLVPALHVIAYPLLLLSTFVHEMGHGLAALLVGGEFHQFTMYADGSGVATMAIPMTAFSSAFSSFGGLVGPAVVGALLFVVGAFRRLCGPALWVLCGLFVAAEVFYIRNSFGLVFVGGYALAFFLLARYGNDLVKQFAVVFLGAQLSLSVFSRADYLFMQWADTAEGRSPSDVQQIADALFLPYWFWGGLIALFSAAVVVFGVWFSLRSIVRHASDAGPSRRRAG